MNNNLKVLKLFVDNKDKPFTINKAAQALRINYKIAYEEVRKLEKEGLLQITKQGNANICIFAYQYHSKIVEIEERRKEELFRNKDIKLIYRRIKEVKSPFYCFLLFGSYASKTNKKSSDIDLCIITDNEEINKEIHSILSITPLPLHLQNFSSKEFKLMLESKKENVGNEIVKNNLIFQGIEGFYEMVNHVKQ